MKRKKTFLRLVSLAAALVLAQQALLFAERADSSAQLDEPFGQHTIQASAAYTSGAALARQELPRLRLCLSGLDQSGHLLFAGVDLAVLEEQAALPGDPEDLNGDGKIFGVKAGKVKRFLHRNINMTVDLGDQSDYQRGIRHRLAMRTLYVGTDSGEIIIADQDNGKDGWVMLKDSEFLLSFFADSDESTGMVRHTAEWDENRIRYNESKQKAGAGISRPYQMFWSGEKLLFAVETNGQVKQTSAGILSSPSGIEITLYEEENGAWRAPYPPVLLTERDSGQDTDASGLRQYWYEGALWEKDMIHKWGADAPQTLLFTAVPVVNGERLTQDTREETILMDNRELFFQLRQRL